jgi:transposase
MNASSLDLREAALAAVDRGRPRAEVAATFGVSPSTLKRWVRRRQTGSLVPGTIAGRPSRLGTALDAGLVAQLQAAPDATIAEHCATWEQTTGQAVSPTTLRRALGRLGWTRQKSLSASEQDPVQRAAWQEDVAALDPAQFVFLDECGTHLAHTRAYGRARQGERAVGHVPRNRSQATTLLASLTPAGIGPTTTRLGGTTKDVFLTYLREEVAPTLAPGQIVILNNLGAHRPAAVRAIVAARGAWLLHLPTRPTSIRSNWCSAP